MSDQRGMWGNSRPEDSNVNAWWQNSSDANATTQQLLAAHQQQLEAAHQQAQVAQSTAAAAHQLFSYKMATSFNNSAPQTTVSSSMSPQNYYRNLQAGNARHDDGGITASQAAVAAGWWYNPSLQNNMANMQNFQQAQNSHSLLNRQRNMPRGGKSDAKPRGRMTAYAFFVQTCREEHKKKHPTENVVFAEFSKKCAERWKTMSDKEKKRFHEMAEKDKKRYESEMQNYIPPKGEKVRGKKRKHFKDPNAPKRALSAFFWFCNDERGTVKAANPEYGVGDIAKELGRRWADCTSTMKQKYEAMAEKDKARYERENNEYKKKSKPSVAPTVAHEEDIDDEEEEDEDDD